MKESLSLSFLRASQYKKIENNVRDATSVRRPLSCTTTSAHPREDRLCVATQREKVVRDQRQDMFKIINLAVEIKILKKKTWSTSP